MSGWPSGVRGGVHFVAGSAPFVLAGWSRPATGTHADINNVTIASDTRLLMRIYDLAVADICSYFFSEGSRPSVGAPVPDEPRNSFCPLASVASRPLALLDPSLARNPTTVT